MDNYINQTKQIIEENIYMTIATASKEGKPWISPVFFAFDKEYNFYWVSNKNSLHSKLIRSNSEVALVIYDSSLPIGKGDAVYVKAKAIELNNEQEIKEPSRLFNERVSGEEFKIKNAEEG